MSDENQDISEDEDVPNDRALALPNPGNNRAVALQGTSTGQMQILEPQFTSQSALKIADGDFRGAGIGNTITYNTYNIPEKSTPKKRKLLDTAEEPGFHHLSGDIYVNFDASFGSRVYKGERRSDALKPEQLAVKLVAVNTKDEAEPLQKEALAIRDNPHRNIVRYISADFRTEKFMNIFLAMELCDPTNLHDRIVEMKRTSRKFTFDDCMSIAKQLSSGLAHLHGNDILHRDIKPSNVLFSIDGKVVKLTDFSLVKPARPGRSETADSSKRIGTDGWRAPEVYTRNSHSKKSDVFSLGLLIYFVWSNGEQAFGSDPDISNFNIKTCRNRDLTKIRFQNDEATNLLKAMLEHLEERRLNSAEVKSHPLCKRSKKELENLLGEISRLPTVGEVAETTFVHGHCIVVFDRITCMMHAFKSSTKCWGHMQAISAEMSGWNMTVVCADDHLFALSETRRLFRIKYTDPNAIWEAEDDMILEHGGLPSSTVLGGHIYAVGGSQWSSKVSKEGERFDLATRKWSRIADMNTPRKVHCVIACNGGVYSIGGRLDSGKNLSGDTEGAEVRGEKFNPNDNKWTMIAPMHNARHAAAATALDIKIFVLGGWRRGNRLSEAECYNTVTNEWTVINNMTVPRSYLSAATSQGKIYAVNGDSLNPLTIEEYDPEHNRWEIAYTMENMTIWACASAAVYLPPPE